MSHPPDPDQASVPGVPERPPEQASRRKPSTIGGVVYLIVVAVSVVGLVVVDEGPWRRGVSLIGVALLGAALARLLLSDFSGGMLRVRSKWFDVPVMIAAGVVLIVLAVVIPNQNV